MEIDQRRRIRSGAALRDLVRDLRSWPDSFGLDPEEAFFRDIGSHSALDRNLLPCASAPFVPPGSQDQISLAWWMSEICRLSYTAAHNEQTPGAHLDLPCRTAILEARTPLREVWSLDTLGNHLAIYEIAEGAGTVLCFRGTSRVRQWIMNTMTRPHRWRRFERPSSGAGEEVLSHIHSGFYVIFRRMWKKCFPVLQEMPRPWIFTGHSLGGALASLAAAADAPDLLCTFGAPKFASAGFSSRIFGGGAQWWRFVTEQDLVPHLPFPDHTRKRSRLCHEVSGIALRENGGARTILPVETDSVRQSLRHLAKARDQNSGPPEFLTEHRMDCYCGRLTGVREGKAG